MTSRVIQLTALMTLLSVAPGILVTFTAFTRIVIVLSILRSALGAQGTPPNPVLIGLALFLTYFVMEPTLTHAWAEGLLPMMHGQISDMDGLHAHGRPVPPLHGGQHAAQGREAVRRSRARDRRRRRPTTRRGACWRRPS